MPFVNIKMIDDNVTYEQKSELVRRITDALVEVLGKKREGCNIVIDEIQTINWGSGGRTAFEIREARAAAEKSGTAS